MSDSQENLYEVLGVPGTATAAQIKTAYFRQVRKHPPEKDAEGFRRIQNAHDILIQPNTREEYDKTQRTDPEARALFDAARKLLENGKANDALPLVKRALARQPDSPVIRDLLTQVLMEQEQYEEAEKQARRVLSLEPDNPTYSVRIGDILRTRDHDADALPYFRKAVLLDRENAQNVIKLAYLLNYLDKPEDAIKLLEQGIQRDGKVDFDDFIYFQCLYTLFTLRERYRDLDSTRERIRTILPPDPEQRSFVAWFYFENAMRMAKLGNFESAVRSIEEAGSIDSSLPGLADTVERLRSSRTAINELTRLRDDESIDTGLRLSCALYCHQRLLGTSDELQEVFEKATEILDDDLATEGAEIGSQVRTVRQRYPALAQLLAELLAEILKMERQAPKRFIRLTCPTCRAKGRTDKPTVQSLMESGLSVSVARQLLSTQGERGALQLLSFTCQKCQTSFNGLSQVAIATPTSAPSSGCFVVTATFGDTEAFPVRTLRAYRDRVLNVHLCGRLLIRLYGVFGPILARCIVRSPTLREASRHVCERLARWAENSLM